MNFSRDPYLETHQYFLQFLIHKDFATSDTNFASGYFYKTYYDSLNCAGIITFVDGYSTGVCLQTSEQHSVKLVGQGMLITCQRSNISTILD